MNASPRQHRICFVAFAVLAFNAGHLTVRADEPLHWADTYLSQGQSQKAWKQAATGLVASPDSDQKLFETGALQFIAATELLGQSFYKMGLKTGPPATLNRFPLLRFPMPTNFKPELATYQRLEATLEAFHQRLQSIEATLAKIDDPNVNMRIRLGRVCLDINGDGEPSLFREDIYHIYYKMNGDRSSRPFRELSIRFDYADAIWLRGYCHFLMGLVDFALAYDWTKPFEISGSDVFSGAKPYDANQTKATFPFVDLIYAMHHFTAPLKDPARMRSAWRHFRAMPDLSRNMWLAVAAETDDDAEWIPSPKQTFQFGRLPLTDGHVTTWGIFLDEAEDVLDGTTLMPFWLDIKDEKGEKGFDVKQFFHEPPKDFDVLLWFQGSAAAPYLKSGRLVPQASRDALQRQFGSRFGRFALWVN